MEKCKVDFNLKVSGLINACYIFLYSFRMKCLVSVSFLHQFKLNFYVFKGPNNLINLT